jgi:hypothetical protein
MNNVALALIQYDPAGALFDQTVRILPRLQQVFADIAVFANAATALRSIEYLRQNGVHVMAQAAQVGLNHLGWFRRAAVQLALHGPCPFIPIAIVVRIGWSFIRRN